MKSTALYDSKGMFIGVMGKIRDITEEMGPELLNKTNAGITGALPSESAPSSTVGMFDKILGKAKVSYKEGLRLSFREGKHAEAIPFFDQAIDIDPSLAYIWHDRGVCYRELGKDTEALLNFDKAVELSPDDEEFLFSRGELLKKTAILRQRRDLLESAVKALNRVVELNPNQAEAWNSLGVLSKELGKELLSRQYYEKARELIRLGKNRKKTRNPELLV